MSAGTRLIQTSVTDETVRLLAAARDAGVLVRVLGGMGIVLHVGDQLHPAFEREIGDIDLATSKRGGRQVSEFLSSQGYAPNKAFNAMNGSRRLLFYDEPNRRQIDVFVGTFEMCHELALEPRLELEPLTLPLAELMLTKLQIIKLNRKDAHDLYALLLTHEVCDHDRDAINGAWIGRLCGQDWGLCHTVELNLARLELELDELPLAATQRQLIRTRIRELQEAVERTPKTTKWRIRARVGDRVRWYEEPEEVEKWAY
jgi:hypothetical protein